MAASFAGKGIVPEAVTKDNYKHWKILVKNYLRGRGIWDGVVEASETAADRENGSDPPELKGNAEAENRKRIDADPSERKRKDAEALHAIQLACGSEKLSVIEKCTTAKQAWNKLVMEFDNKVESDVKLGKLGDIPSGYKVLFSHVAANELTGVKSHVVNDPKKCLSDKSKTGKTILHAAAMFGHEKIVKYLVEIASIDVLIMEDKNGYTALALAAAFTRNAKVAKPMVVKCRDLLTMKTKDKHKLIPVVLAAAKGHWKMTQYLYSQMLDPHQNASSVLQEYAGLLFTKCIISEIFDVALSLLHRYKNPPLPLDVAAHGIKPLCALSQMPSAFLSGCQYNWLQKLIYNCLKPQVSIEVIPDVDQKEPGGLRQLLLYIDHKLLGIRGIYEQKSSHIQVCKILELICNRLMFFSQSELKKVSASDAMLQAAENGIAEFINAMIDTDREFLLKAFDHDNRGIFSKAIMRRRRNVFELIHRLDGRKQVLTSITDRYGNNLLHLAAKLGPPSDHDLISGAALQMQRELQWFQAVKEVMHRRCQKDSNRDNKRPHEVFTDEHLQLVKEGEKWAKETAQSFTIVGTLIITMMFAAAFTVPGGSNTSGIPVFLRDKLFTVFIIADAVSLCTATLSSLVFVGILTSRFAERDFLWTLPMTLLFGLYNHFVSVASMLVCFCAALFMMLQGRLHVTIVAIALAGVTVLLMLLPSQSRLFWEILFSTFGPFMKKRKNSRNNGAMNYVWFRQKIGYATSLIRPRGAQYKQLSEQNGALNFV